MVESYRIRAAAVRDLDQIWLYGAEQYSQNRADLYDIELHEAFERVAKFPEIGRELFDVARNVRFLVVRSHIIVYQPKPVEIIRVLHQRSDWMQTIGSVS